MVAAGLGVRERHVRDRMAVPATGGYSKDDLIGYAILGLIESIERYDPARGVFRLDNNLDRVPDVLVRIPNGRNKLPLAGAW